MLQLFLVSCLIIGIFAAPAEIIPEAPVVSHDANLVYAVDFSQLASPNQMSCIRAAGYSAVFIRAYDPTGNGQFDINACGNVNNAFQAGLGTEAYMTPQPMSTKAGYQQLDEIYTGFTSKGVTIRSIWIQVTAPRYWPANVNNNINFINSIVSRARQYGWSIGIYTSFNDWNQIANGWAGLGTDVMLWYWNVLGSGPSGETQPNFGDFRPFGCWNGQPAVKQFAQVESLCSITVNRDVYNPGPMIEGMAHREYEKPTGPVVGGVFHH